MLRSESSSRIWIDTTCGLFIAHKSQAGKQNERNRTSAVLPMPVTRHLLYFAQFF